MDISSITKLLVCILIVLAATLLGIFRIIDSNQVGMLLTGVLGYVFGNGHGIMSIRQGEKGDKGDKGDNGNGGHF